MNPFDPFDSPGGERIDAEPTTVADTPADVGHRVLVTAVWPGITPPSLRELPNPVIEDLRKQSKRWENEAKTLRAQLENLTEDMKVLRDIVDVNGFDVDAYRRETTKIAELQRVLEAREDESVRQAREIQQMRHSLQHMTDVAKTRYEGLERMLAKLGVNVFDDGMNEIERLQSREALVMRFASEVSSTRR
jgi:hypothetical protein